MPAAEMDLKLCELVAPPPSQLIQNCILADEMDLEALRDLCSRYTSIKAGNLTFNNTENARGPRTKKQSCIEDKENFLMPAPKERPLRVRKRKTRDIDDEVKPRGSRVTRSSRMTSALHEDECMTDKPVRSRATKSTIKALSHEIGPSEVSIISDSDSSITGESRKGRRGTKKVREDPAPRASRRGTRSIARSSTRASIRTSTRASARVSTRASTRASSRINTHPTNKCNSSVVHAKQSVQPTRTTRAGAGKDSPHIDPEASLIHFKSPILADSQPSKKKTKQKLLFSPYDKSTVKARVEAFEGLSSLLTDPMETRGKVKGAVPKGASTDEAHHDDEVPSKIVRTSAVFRQGEAQLRVDSPLVKAKNKLSSKKVSTLIIKEEINENVSLMEVEEMDVVIEELLKTSHTGEELANAQQPEGSNNDGTFLLSSNEAKKDDDNEADDEWMTDDEDKTPDSQKESTAVNSSTPTKKVSSSLKLAQEVGGSYKALRSRKINKASSEVALTLSSKAKKTPALTKSVTTALIPPRKTLESEIKEAELKRQQEKELEALKRKEELLKQRTETTKKKREEKMSKVKRTREEKEKEIEATKVKKAKQAAKKKKVKEVEPEVEVKKTPVKQIAAPIKNKQLDSTFTKPVVEESGGYDMTPHWADVSPKQPVNPNDYGVVDKSDCSSEEENDPRKKVPSWTKKIRLGLLHDNLVPTRHTLEFWQTKPRAPTISMFFGNKVSKNTLRRGLHYRTSSAIWHVPPI